MNAHPSSEQLVNCTCFYLLHCTFSTIAYRYFTIANISVKLKKKSVIRVQTRWVSLKVHKTVPIYIKASARYLSCLQTTTTTDIQFSYVNLFYIRFTIFCVILSKIIFPFTMESKIKRHIQNYKNNTFLEWNYKTDVLLLFVTILYILLGPNKHDLMLSDCMGCSQVINEIAVNYVEVRMWFH